MVVINLISNLNNKYYLLINSINNEKKALKLFSYLESLNLKKRASSFFELRTSNINEFIKQLLNENEINENECVIFFDFIKQKNF